MQKKILNQECAVEMLVDNVVLNGDLCIPDNAGGIVVFAHGTGSNRYSPRNQFVAQVLQQANLATLLFGLLSVDEEAEDLITGRPRFDIPLLGRRLIAVTDWLQSNERVNSLKIGYFGASTGAAAALTAAAKRPELVGAVVSRGGRPDLAMPLLGQVRAPTLLIVGGNDFQVIDMNRSALVKLNSEKNLVIIPGATHLFEEPGALDQVAKIARDWFCKYLTIKTGRTIS
jgi:putative phosphoribosyl transferase